MSDECDAVVHVFTCYEGEITPPETRCECGEVTWDDMNRRLVIHDGIAPASRN